jgi:hypothetical protein
VLQLLVTANVVPSSPILSTLIKEAIDSSETSVLTRTTRRRILRNGILHRVSTVTDYRYLNKVSTIPGYKYVIKVSIITGNRYLNSQCSYWL